jgi:hypothetical protein
MNPVKDALIKSEFINRKVESATMLPQSEKERKNNVLTSKLIRLIRLRGEILCGLA